MEIDKEKEFAKSLNTLAREDFIRKLLAEICVDLEVCKLEGYDHREFITRLKQEIDSIYFKFIGGNNDKRNDDFKALKKV